MKDLIDLVERTFGISLKKYNFEVGEVQTEIHNVCNLPISFIMSAQGKLFVRIGLTLYSAPKVKVRSFYLDYDENRNKYWGMIINEEFVVYTRRGIYGEFSGVGDKDHFLFSKVSPE